MNWSDRDYEDDPKPTPALAYALVLLLLAGAVVALVWGLGR